MSGLARWAALPDLPEMLPGEDRAYGTGLFAEPIPSTAWWTHAHYCIAGQDWERVRRMVMARAGRRCEACGRGEDREGGIRMEAHERWVFDTAARAQRLRRLVCLCSDCHTVTHFGLAQLRGVADHAFLHLREVTGHVRGRGAAARASRVRSMAAAVGDLVGPRPGHPHRRRDRGRQARWILRRPRADGPR